MGKFHLLETKNLIYLAFALCSALSTTARCAETTEAGTILPIAVLQPNDRLVKVLDVTARGDVSGITVTGRLRGRKPRQRLKETGVPYTLTIRVLDAANRERAMATEQFSAHALHQDSSAAVFFSHKLHLYPERGDKIAVTLEPRTGPEEK